jgi:hypothetical protein
MSADFCSWPAADNEHSKQSSPTSSTLNGRSLTLSLYNSLQRYNFFLKLHPFYKDFMIALENYQFGGYPTIVLLTQNGLIITVCQPAA